MKLITPDKCLRPSSLDLFEEQRDRWILEPKIDGSWCLLEINEKGRARYTTSSGNLFTKNVLKNLNNVTFSRELRDSSFICELETHTNWSVTRSLARGYVIGHIHTLLTLQGESFVLRPYRESKAKLSEIFRFFIGTPFVLGKSAHKDFVSAFKSFTKDVCYEGAVIKRLDMNILPTKNGRLKHWYKIKEFGT